MSKIAVLITINIYYPQRNLPFLSQWAGFFGTVKRLLRNRAVISVTTGLDHDRQNLPLQSINHILPGFQQSHSQF